METQPESPPRNPRSWILPQDGKPSICWCQWLVPSWERSHISQIASCEDDFPCFFEVGYVMLVPWRVHQFQGYAAQSKFDKRNWYEMVFQKDVSEVRQCLISPEPKSQKQTIFTDHLLSIRSAWSGCFSRVSHESIVFLLRIGHPFPWFVGSLNRKHPADVAVCWVLCLKHEL